MKITIQSKSGEFSFPAAASESILYAGLQHGLTLPYECATGTCGTCRARVMSGDFEVRWKEAPGGARLKPEKGDVLMCQTHPRSDCVLRVPSNIDIVEQALPSPSRGIIRNIQNLTRDVVHFDLHLDKPMDFRAGQFVVLEAPDLPGGRAYSMVNFESPADRLVLLVKRKPGGGFSDWLAARQDEPELKVFGPLGRAVFAPEENRNIVCIAGGSGIAGMMSILERASGSDYFRNHKGFVFFGVRTLADTFYLDRLAQFVAAGHENLKVTLALSDEIASGAAHSEYPTINLLSGMVHEVAAKAMQGAFGDAIIYLAGPPVMVDSAIRMLIVGGVPIKDIRYDKFG